MKELTASELVLIRSLLVKEWNSHVDCLNLLVEHGQEGRPQHQKCAAVIAELQSCFLKIMNMHTLKAEEQDSAQ